MIKTFLGITAAIALLGLSSYVYATSATGNATATVTAALAITNASDLAFGSAPQGDPSKTVAPGTVEDGSNGSFNVAGQASTAYTITLPADGTVTMTTGGGGSADKIIAVNSFTSFPATTGSLDASGNQLLLVGATRAALSATQTAGAYTGTYTVDVVY